MGERHIKKTKPRKWRFKATGRLTLLLKLLRTWQDENLVVRKGRYEVTLRELRKGE